MDSMNLVLVCLENAQQLYSSPFRANGIEPRCDMKLETPCSGNISTWWLLVVLLFIQTEPSWRVRFSCHMVAHPSIVKKEFIIRPKTMDYG